MKSLKILQHPLVKKSLIADTILPDEKQPRQKLHYKESNLFGHSITEEDDQKIIAIWEQMKKDIDG